MRKRRLAKQKEIKVQIDDSSEEMEGISEEGVTESSDEIIQDVSDEEESEAEEKPEEDMEEESSSEVKDDDEDGRNDDDASDSSALFMKRIRKKKIIREREESSDSEILTRSQRRERQAKKKKLKRLSAIIEKGNEKDSAIVLDSEDESESDFQDDKTECTVCFRRLNKRYIYAHPLLDVAACSRCVKQYRNSDWPKDDDGYDEFCRWSMKSSDSLWLCETCNRAFDSECIKDNLGHKAYDKIDAMSEWHCFVCQPDQLKSLPRDWPKLGEKKKKSKKLSLGGDNKPRKKGKYRRNIKTVLSDNELSAEAQKAMKEEKNRLKLLKEREEKFKEQGEKYDKSGRVCVNPYHEDFEKPIFIVDDIGGKLKKHQISGIRFLWNNICGLKKRESPKTESKEKVKAVEKDSENSKSNTKKTLSEVDTNTLSEVKDVTKMVLDDASTDEGESVSAEKTEKMEKEGKLGETSGGSDKIVTVVEGTGCILAHLMGLGKTLQSITIITTFLNSGQGKHVMIVAPVNVLSNWKFEFTKWLKKEDRPNVVSLVDGSTKRERLRMLKRWSRDGGALIVGFEMMRNLCVGRRLTKSDRESFQALLLEEADLVVVDEGHRIKNATTGLAKVLSQLGTKRRIILTGTPLQNNLMEYYYMIDFVRPNFMGTSRDFKNRFETPILNGQCVDSEKSDVRLMRERAFVLHNKVQGFVHRRGYSDIAHELPLKYVYTVFVSMSELQCKLYKKYLRFVSRRASRRLFQDYHMLNKIWNHPNVLRIAHKTWYKKHEAMVEKLEEELADEEFIDNEQDEETEEGSSTDDSKKMKERVEKLEAKRKQRQMERKSKIEEKRKKMEYRLAQGMSKNGLKHDWFQSYFDKANVTDDVYDMDISLGPKFQLTIELLQRIVAQGEKAVIFSNSLMVLDMLERAMEQHLGYEKQENYFRIDGSVGTDIRQKDIRAFNDPDSDQTVFLLSTKAGGLGINLIGANHAIIFDSSWNPSHDLQAIFRIYRFGQKKDVFVYRLVSHNTMEQKIYERQLTKRGLALRVVDEKQVQRHFMQRDLQELYTTHPGNDDDDEDYLDVIDVSKEEVVPKKETDKKEDKSLIEAFVKGLKSDGALDSKEPQMTVFNPYENCRKEFSQGSLMWWLLARYGDLDQKKDAFTALKQFQTTIEIEQDIAPAPTPSRRKSKRLADALETESEGSESEELPEPGVFAERERTEKILESKKDLLKTALKEEGVLKPVHLIHGFHMPTVLLEHIDTEALNDDERKMALQNFENSVTEAKNKELQAQQWQQQRQQNYQAQQLGIPPFVLAKEPPSGWPVNKRIPMMLRWGWKEIVTFLQAAGLQNLERAFYNGKIFSGAHFFFMQEESAVFLGVPILARRQFMKALITFLINGSTSPIWQVHLTTDGHSRLFFYNVIQRRSQYEVPVDVQYDFGKARMEYYKMYQAQQQQLQQQKKQEVTIQQQSQPTQQQAQKV